jgi:hypothetical protein
VSLIGLTPSVLADSDVGKGSPIGLLVVLLLIVAVYFLYRSMNRHLRKVPPEFDPPGERPVEADRPPVQEHPPVGEQPPVGKQPPVGERASDRQPDRPDADTS